ncbi:MAG: hypothetical protein V9G25_00525 [Acidimicrobiia bacterium]
MATTCPNTPSRLERVSAEIVIKAINANDIENLKRYFEVVRELFSLNGLHKAQAKRIRVQVLNTISNGDVSEDMTKFLRGYFEFTGVQLCEIPAVVKLEKYGDQFSLITAKTSLAGDLEPSEIKDIIKATLNDDNKGSQSLFRNFICESLRLSFSGRQKMINDIRKHLASIVRKADAQTISLVFSEIKNTMGEKYFQDNPLKLTEIEALLKSKSIGILREAIANNTISDDLNPRVIAVCIEAVDQLDCNGRKSYSASNALFGGLLMGHIRPVSYEELLAYYELAGTISYQRIANKVKINILETLTLNSDRMSITKGKNMKTMTCEQLGGACDLKFSAETFKDISDQSRAHGMEMFQKQDEDHKGAMGKMTELMQTPGAMQTWMADKEKEFDAVPQD